jgi:hypothetical protein
MKFQVGVLSDFLSDILSPEQSGEPYDETGALLHDQRSIDTFGRPSRHAARVCAPRRILFWG